ncbi:MAG: hypothetical protein KDJ65_35905 [Anaerolineae bacterium]|nr:hypothetical protein [Anaerolineae bacterium]
MNIIAFLKKSRPRFDLLVTLFGVVIVFFLSQRYDCLEAMVHFTRQHENWELDEIIPVIMFLALAFSMYSVRRWLETVRAKKVADELNVSLKASLAEVKVLKEILPICANCKKIRDDQGYWQQVESYISKHTDTSFSHGICPDCMKTLYPEYYMPQETIA